MFNKSELETLKLAARLMQSELGSDFFEEHATALVIQNETGLMQLEAKISSMLSQSELAMSDDQYKALGVSVEHLTDTDLKLLEAMADNPENNMVMGRATGWLVKLYGNEGESEKYSGMSEGFQDVLKKASEAGFRLVEFDTDATTYNAFPVQQS